MEKRLAIIIPVYKVTFLKKTLQSIANQTCKNFTLYLGDDASPNNILELVKSYEGQMDVVYKRFERNIGNMDLVSHWERCIEMSHHEEWIWLFSDDDLMNKDCVEYFYKFIERNKESKLLHFNVQIIDAKDRYISRLTPFPLKLTGSDFFEKKVKGEINSFVVEYLFKREVYIENGKFQRFDLAWCTDDATWIKFSKDNSIVTFADEPMVYWRYSGENISSSNTNIVFLERKLKAKIEFIKWAYEYFKKQNVRVDIFSVTKIKWLLLEIKEARNLSLIRRCWLSYKYSKAITNPLLGLISVAYVLYYRIKNV